VLPKGDWLQRLGLGEAASYLGNDNSICLRVPDCGPLAYVVSMAGPVALTSANISGGDDSIHHDMVIDTLGTMFKLFHC
jgi:tRNA A37 threonylcarbamoyladenosine synthetase subunit TsaC/SUA5/YrdC